MRGSLFSARVLLFPALPQRKPKRRKVYSNARMGPRDVRRFYAIGEEAEKLLETAVTKLGLSARAYDRVLKVARTIVDLARDVDIGTAHISEVIQYRMMDRAR